MSLPDLISRLVQKGSARWKIWLLFRVGHYGTTVVAKVTDDEEKISSSLIRELLSQRGM